MRALSNGRQLPTCSVDPCFNGLLADTQNRRDFRLRQSFDRSKDERLLERAGQLRERLPESFQLFSVAGCFIRSRSEEHTSELQSLMRISYAVFCLKKKKKT